MHRPASAQEYGPKTSDVLFLRRSANCTNRGNYDCNSNRQRFASARFNNSSNTGCRAENPSRDDGDKLNESRDWPMNGTSSRDQHVIVHGQCVTYPLIEP